MSLGVHRSSQLQVLCEADFELFTLSMNRSWDRQEELGGNMVTDEASAAWKCLESMVAFRVVHI